MTILKRLLLVLFVLFACVGCDQSTKFLAEAKLPSDAPLSFASDMLRLQVTHNEGAFLSLGATLPEAWRLAAFRIGVSAILLALLIYILVVKRGGVAILLPLTLVLAGGTSNLIDRVVHSAYVVDFINVGIGPVRTGIFNVADLAITAGTFLLFIYGLRSRKSAT
jgi:signal peptidase II